MLRNEEMISSATLPPTHLERQAGAKHVGQVGHGPPHTRQELVCLVRNGVNLLARGSKLLNGFLHQDSSKQPEDDHQCSSCQQCITCSPTLAPLQRARMTPL